MKLIFKKTAILLFFAIIATVAAFAQKESKFSVDAEADLVSSYVWRGMYQGGVNFQPALSFSVHGITLGTWGSTDMRAFAKEVDFYLSYEIGRFYVAVTDYWWMNEGESFFKERSGDFFEASLVYSVSKKFPLSFGVNTMFRGDGDKNEKGEQLYSTYISASYPFSVGNTDCEISIGISPWKGMYSDKFDVAAITAKASKNLKVTDNFSLPVSVELVLSPAQDNAYLVFGLKFR